MERQVQRIVVVDDAGLCPLGWLGALVGYPLDEVGNHLRLLPDRIGKIAINHRRCVDTDGTVGPLPVTLGKGLGRDRPCGKYHQQIDQQSADGKTDGREQVTAQHEAQL